MLNKDRQKMSRFSEPRQERIYRRLLMIGPGPASFYLDACQLMESNPPLKTTTHLVSHLLREIESGIRAVLKIIIDSNDDLKKDNGHKNEIILILKALGISETHSITQTWINLTGKKNLFGFAARAHRDKLAMPRPIDLSFRKLWEDMELILDIVLEKVESRFLKFFNKLDELLVKQKPTNSDTKLLQLNVPNNFVTCGYFFDKLTNPAWIEVLNTEGFFKNPPQPITDETTNTIYPSWPESRYLARMANLTPEIVLETILKIPKTSNLRVHVDFSEAACAMPPQLAARWAEKEIDWLKSQQNLSFLLPQKLGELISHLAKGEQEQTALKLAANLLSLLPDPDMNKVNNEFSSYCVGMGSPKPRTRMDEWEYEEIIKKNIPDLAKIAGKETLNLLCNLLKDAIIFSRYQEEAKNQDDNSYLWRLSIEDREENHPFKLRDLLVTAVRDAAASIMEKEDLAALKLIERKFFKVFKRIGLHLRRKFPEMDPDGTAKLLVDPKLFDDIQVEHEFFHLLREQYQRLPSDMKQEYLALVEKGKDIQQWLDFQEQENKSRPTQEDGKRELREWKYDRLYPIQHYLDQKWQEKFNRLKEEFGEPAHPDFPVYIGKTWVGPTSPKTSEELRAMDIQEIISYLKTWQPSEESRSPSPEGLGRALTSIITTEPERIAAEAMQFQHLDPTYVRFLFSGLRDAAQKQIAFTWAPVLELGQWVVSQPREIPGRKSEYGNLDTGWGWTRKSIAALLSEGFKLGRSKIPYEFRNLAWSVLEALTSDPEPTPEHEKRYGGTNMDPATLSINTTRGEAMHAVVHYALWVREHIIDTKNKEEYNTRGFEEMPEARRILDFHLLPDNDPSLAIRAVYGQWFPWLVLLDSDWAAQNVKKIFHEEKPLIALRKAAWGIYICLCDSYDNVFDVLIQEYYNAVEQIGVDYGYQLHIADPDQRLAEHLMVLYWRGKLNLDDKNGLLDRFYLKASPELRQHALIYVGRKFYESKIEIAPDIIKRLQKLWEYRFKVIRRENTNESKLEIEAFGWWFISEKFDNEWSINQLKEVLKVGGKIEPAHQALEHLKNFSTIKPLTSVECLEIFIKDENVLWFLQGDKYSENARAILNAALKSSDGKAQQIAEDLIHRLGAQGILAFRDLIAGKKS